MDICWECLGFSDYFFALLILAVLVFLLASLVAAEVKDWDIHHLIKIVLILIFGLGSAIYATLFILNGFNSYSVHFHTEETLAQEVYKQPEELRQCVVFGVKALYRADDMYVVSRDDFDAVVSDCEVKLGFDVLQRFAGGANVDY